MDASLPKLIENAFNVIGPDRLRVPGQIGDGKDFAVRKCRRSQLNLSVVAQAAGHVNVLINGQGQNQAVIVVGMIAK